MSKTYTNSGKSIRERLLNLSRAEQYNPQMMISRYMQERFFDVYSILISNRVDANILTDAIKFTFANRETGYRENHPLFTEEFFTSTDRKAFWNGFLRKIKYKESLDFPTIGMLIKQRLQPYWESLRQTDYVPESD